MRFTNKSKEVEKVSARLREEAKLQAELSDTEATVKWMKDGKELKASEKYEFQTIGKKRILKIRSTAEEDTGVYECVCEGDKMLYQLSVKGEWLPGLLCTNDVPALNPSRHTKGVLQRESGNCPSTSSFGSVVPQQNWGANTAVGRVVRAVLSLQLASWYSREFGLFLWGQWWVGKSALEMKESNPRGRTWHKTPSLSHTCCVTSDKSLKRDFSSD